MKARFPPMLPYIFVVHKAPDFVLSLLPMLSVEIFIVAHD